MITAAINFAADKFSRSVLGGTAARLSREIVSKAESESSEAFVRQINKAMGINISELMNEESLANYIDVSVESNVALIKSLSSDYFDDIQFRVLDGFRRGESYTTIAAGIQNVTGSTYKRAELIARDQTSKLRSDITRQRQINAGITRFKWSTSKDVRVSGNPAGRYPNAKIKCFMIARQDVGYGPGVYLTTKGASYAGECGLFPGRAHIGCRCTSTPQIQGLDY